jgi:integrase
MKTLKKIKYSVIFNRKGQLNINGEGLIQIKAYQNGKNRYFSTDIYVAPSHWDSRNKKVKHNHPTQFVYNQRITEQLQKMEAFEIKMINRFGFFPLSRLHEYQSPIQQRKEALTFSDFYNNELELSGMKWDSYKMYAQTLNKLLAFRSPTHFEDLSYQFVLEFDRFLKRKGLSANSVKKHHHRLRTFIYKAIKQDFLEMGQNPYLRFKPKGEEPDRPYLSKADLKKLEDFRLPQESQHLNRVRDIYLFSVYTGLRFGDVTQINPSQVFKEEKGLILKLKSGKTGKILALPLYALFKVKGEKYSKPERILIEHLAPLEGIEAPNFKIFQITNQYFNRALKELAVLTGIRKRITAHTARRTFATLMATKVKAPILQRLLQHSRPDMTAIYIQLSNTEIEQELEQIEWNQ